MLCTERELNNHVKYAHTKLSKEDLIQCDICYKTFLSKILLRKHLKRHAKKQLSDVQLKVIADNFDMTCDQCDATFVSYYDARKHYKEHHNMGYGYIKCCGMKLKYFGVVRDHIDTHLNPGSSK